MWVLKQSEESIRQKLHDIDLSDLGYDTQGTGNKRSDK